MLLRIQCCSLCLMLIAALLSGCNQSKGERLLPVNGSVLIDGQPPQSKTGYIMLKADVSKGNNTSLVPAGVIDVDGHYELFTGQRRGAPPGWYKVIVTATTAPPNRIPAQSTTRPVAKSLLPPQYG